VVVLAIKLRLAPKLALLRVTIVAKKVMSLETALRPQKPKNVSSVVWKATSLASVLLIPAVEEAEEEEEEEEEVEVENVTNVAKSGISLVHALTLVMEEDTMHSVVTAVVRRRLVIHVAA